jgi:hypothetical protein
LPSTHWSDTTWHNIKQIDNQSNILKSWCGMHEPIIWRTSYVAEGSIKDKESSCVKIKSQTSCFFLLLLWTGFRCHRQERHTSYLLPGYSEISMYAWKSYKILTYMIIISYPGTTLSNAHELTLSSLLQINVWRASVDGAPILKLGDSSVYLASLFFLYKDNQIIYIYLCVYI